MLLHSSSIATKAVIYFYFICKFFANSVLVIKGMMPPNEKNFTNTKLTNSLEDMHVDCTVNKGAFDNQMS